MSRYETALGKAVKILRTERGLNRKELAERAGLSYPFLSEIESGRKSPSPRSQRAIAAALEVSPSELVAEAERLAMGKRRWFHGLEAGEVYPLSLEEPMSAPRQMQASLAPPESWPSNPEEPSTSELLELWDHMPTGDKHRLLDLARRLSHRS